MRHTIVMVTTSYPRFAGDNVGSFVEPIATGVAARGHIVHVVAPWHPAIRRAPDEHGVRLHFFKYAPARKLNVFGYAESMKADTHLRITAIAATPLALAAGVVAARAVARRARATVVHGHWLVPGGAIAAAAARHLPVVVSLHGSDVYLAERQAAVRPFARRTLGRANWVTACSADLRDRAVALGADPARSEVLPYGVDTSRFRPTEATGDPTGSHPPVVFSAGRLVRKKGFEYLIDAVALLGDRVPTLRLVIAGDGDLAGELKERAATRGIAARVEFPGTIAQDEVGARLASADVAVVPSVRDDAGNVDGLPNVVMEALASGTPLIATDAGGIAAVVEHGHTGLIVPQHDARALADAIAAVVTQPEVGRHLGAAARETARQRFGWERYAERLEEIYDRVLTNTVC